jgi:cytochrome b561
MIEKTERLPIRAAGSRDDGRSVAFHRSLGLLVASVGVLGLLLDSSRKHTYASWINIHALFGSLLWFWVVIRFHERSRRSLHDSPTDIRAFSRRLSRTVYLLLYFLMCVKQITGIATFTPDRTMIGSAEEFQVYLAYGVLALVTIHGLAALWRHVCFRSHGTSAVAALARHGPRMIS